MKELFAKYLSLLDSADYTSLIGLFTDDAQVISPLYGKVKAAEYYRQLFNDTTSAKSRLTNVFTSVDNPLVGAAQYRYRWSMKNGTDTIFDCIAIATLAHCGKIKEMNIIYDSAYTTRKAYWGDVR